MELFNEYGNPPLDGVISKFDDELSDFIKKFLETLPPDISILELRGIEQYLVSCVTNIFSFDRLNRQIKCKKEKRFPEKS